MIDEKLKKIKERYKDDYLNKLSIADHLRECIFLYDYDYKYKKTSIKLYKELADLKILLDIFFEKKEYRKELIEMRIDKFIENIEKMKGK